MTYKLDPRPARTLTSREIAKIMGATFGFHLGQKCGTEKAKGGSMGVEELVVFGRKALRIAMTMFQTQNALGVMMSEAAAHAEEALMAGQVISVVSDNDMCGRDEIGCALGWWLESEAGSMAFESVCAKVVGAFSTHREMFDGLVMKAKKD